MSTTISGIGSGLDINGIVEQLVAAERAPTNNRLNLQEARANAELSAVGQLKSALSTFQDSLEALSELENFQQRSVAISDDELLTATVDSSAVPGTYDIEVKSLASIQKLRSGAFTDGDTVVGTGDLTISVGAETAIITIPATANTLVGIRDTINAADNNPGIAATIVNAEDGAYLILTTRETGAENQIKITQSGGDGGLASLTYDAALGTNPLTEVEAAADAQIIIDGLSISSATNSVSGAIDGVVIDVLAAAPGSIVDLDVTLDSDAASASVEEFVSAYNALINTIVSVTTFNAETGEAAPLLGDSVVRSIKNSIRREITSVVDIENVNFSTLSEIGLQTEASGTLELDSDILSAAIAEDFDGVGLLFASDNGIAKQLGTIIEGFLSSAGQISNREITLNDQLERITTQRESLDARMASVQERLLRQFNAMDQLVAQLNNTSTFLATQLTGSLL